jgi:hypothetical protein
MMDQKKITVAFDVNNTLTVPGVQKLFEALDRNKCHLIVWSTLGADYAKDYCQSKNLEADEYLDKEARTVDIAIDDIPQSIEAALVVLGVIS